MKPLIASEGTPMRQRFEFTRRLMPWLSASLVVGLLGCSSAPPAPAVQWVRLPALPQARAAATPPSARATTWQLLLPVALPGHLDRDAVLVPQGAAGLQPLGGARWAEPLRDAVPRLLLDDLSQLLGPGRVWATPLPPGWVPERQVRLAFTRLDVGLDGRSVQLSAGWSLSAAGTGTPMVGQAVVEVPAASADAQALAVAHRQALWQLAQQLAAALR
jgi:uncharacterized protein